MGRLVNANVWVAPRDPRLGGTYQAARFPLPTSSLRLGGTYIPRMMGQHRATRAIRATRAVPGVSRAIRATRAIPYRRLLGQEAGTVTTLPATARERIQTLCANHPEVCARLCDRFPMARFFFNTACAAPLAGLGQDEAELEAGATALETAVTTEIYKDPTAVETIPGGYPGPMTNPDIVTNGQTTEPFYTTAVNYATSGIDWAKANPLIAAAVIGGALLLMGGKRR